MVSEGSSWRTLELCPAGPPLILARFFGRNSQRDMAQRCLIFYSTNLFFRMKRQCFCTVRRFRWEFIGFLLVYQSERKWKSYNIRIAFDFHSAWLRSVAPPVASKHARSSPLAICLRLRAQKCYSSKYFIHAPSDIFAWISWHELQLDDRSPGGFDYWVMRWSE